LFGKTKQDKQRYQCLNCKKTFVWKKPYNKKYKEQHWFKLWITEGYSVRQLVNISGNSKTKIFRIINYWLSKKPKCSKIDLSQVKYLAFDGTYFHKDGCLIVLFDIINKKYLYYEYVKKENYVSVIKMCQYLNINGLNPIAITVDGHQEVIKALKEIWPKILVQRCLFHIRLQGQMWLRKTPRTEAGKALKTVLSELMIVKNNDLKNIWINKYFVWHEKYRQEILSLAKTSIAAKDLRRAMSLINNALPDMFHFLKDQKIASTTNLLENFFSILKQHYRNHRGITESHKIAYLKWFCYYKNQAK
jgi:hypothetical protein